MLDKDLHILISAKEVERLRKEAFKKRVSIGVIVREALELYFQKSKSVKK